MGGFELVGPNFRFKNKLINAEDKCLCFGLRAYITQEQEKFLIDNYPKEIPRDFLKQLNPDNKHIGEELLYLKYSRLLHSKK